MNDQLLRAIDEAAGAESLLIASDFDGTLALLVDDPLKSTPHPRAIALIDRLASCTRTRVVIISGRGLADLKARVGRIQGIELIGSHGAEAEEGLIAPPDAQRYLRLARVLDGIARHAPGAWVERKPLSLVLHFRNVPAEKHADLQRMLIAFVPATAVARVMFGRDTVEYLFVHVDKGIALRRRLDAWKPARALFIGDDATDEYAFAGMRPGDITIKIGPEPTIARFRVATIDEGFGALEKLAVLRENAAEQS